MQLAYYDTYGRFGVATDGKLYEYYGLAEKDIRKARRYIRDNLKGKLMQFLKQFSRTDLHERGEGEAQCG